MANKEKERVDSSLCKHKPTTKDFLAALLLKGGGVKRCRYCGKRIEVIEADEKHPKDSDDSFMLLFVVLFISVTMTKGLSKIIPGLNNFVVVVINVVLSSLIMHIALVILELFKSYELYTPPEDGDKDKPCNDESPDDP